MSVTTSYGRLTINQLESIRASRSGLISFSDGTLPTDQSLYLDKASPVIAWLLSPLKRHEQLYFAALVQAGDLESYSAPDFGPDPPMDHFLLAIEGRGEDKQEELDLGLGPACYFSSREVKEFSVLLGSVTRSHLAQQLDFKAMDEAELPLDYWQEEGQQAFDDYIFPLFQQLQDFYRQAAERDQGVLVWNS